MPVHAVVRSIQLASDKPLPKRRLIGIEGGMPILIPTQHVGVFAKAFWKILFAEAFVHGGVREVRLSDKFRRRIKIFFFPPMHCNLRFAGLNCRFASLSNVSHLISLSPLPQCGLAIAPGML